MECLKKISEYKLSLVLIFLTMGVIITTFTNIKFVDFILAFMVATLFAFYIEYNNSQSKLMIVLKKYF
jgi:hypothetical protein